MSDSNFEHGAGPGKPPPVGPLDRPGADGPGPISDSQPGEPAATRNDNHLTELKRQLEDTRLPASCKATILTDLPSAEEQQRLYRELQEKGGLSFEEFMDSLELEIEPQP